MAEARRGQQNDDVATFFSLARDPDAALAPDDRVIDLLKRIAANGASVARFRRMVVAGIVAFAAGAAAAPIMLAVGLAGLATTGAARFFVKSTANSDRKSSKMIGRLLEKA